MIDYNIEFTKGILFIRLYGVLNLLNEKELEDEIVEIIKEGGIKYLVINIKDLEITSDVTIFSRCNEVINDNDGKMLLCCENAVDNFDYTFDELSAIKILSTC